GPIMHGQYRTSICRESPFCPIVMSIAATRQETQNTASTRHRPVHAGSYPVSHGDSTQVSLPVPSPAPDHHDGDGGQDGATRQHAPHDNAFPGALGIPALGARDGTTGETSPQRYRRGHVVRQRGDRVDDTVSGGGVGSC